MTLSLKSVLLLFLYVSACVSQSIVDDFIPNDDVCLVRSGEDCEQTSQDRFPPSWVTYLHNFEAAKHHHVKSCKASVVIEGGSLHCSYARAIEADLKIFDKISLKDLDASRATDQHAVTYQVINGELFRSLDCLFPSRCEGIEYFLLKLRNRLPNLEFVVNTHDWPYINRHFHQKAIPLFSFSKTADYSDIFFPAWAFWSGGPAISKYPTGLGRWDIMMSKLEDQARLWPWTKKHDLSFFRGSRTSTERDSLVKLSRANPDLVDAQYTKNQAWKSKADTLDMDPAKEVSLEEHCSYRYLFNFRGVAASFRFKHLFLCGSLVFHVGDEWDEFFYSAMIPWYHYVPVPSQASQEELKDLILFVKTHPLIAKSIANNGYNFIKENLRMIDVENYWFALLKSYSKLLDFKLESPNHSFLKLS